jgi:hypothetical protein
LNILGSYERERERGLHVIFLPKFLRIETARMNLSLSLPPPLGKLLTYIFDRNSNREEREENFKEVHLMLDFLQNLYGVS